MGFYDNDGQCILYMQWLNTRNKRFSESNVPNDLIPAEIAINTSPIDFL